SRQRPRVSRNIVRLTSSSQVDGTSAPSASESDPPQPQRVQDHGTGLRPHLSEIHTRGAGVVAVGNGGPHFVAAFRETTGFEGPVYCDPDLVAYRAAGLQRSKVRLLDPRGIAD